MTIIKQSYNVGYLFFKYKICIQILKDQQKLKNLKYKF